MPRRWSPSPVMSASLCLHGLGAAGLAAEPAAWPQLLGALACNHALLACGMHPRSGMLGRNLTRLPGRGVRGDAINFDDGPHPEVTPRTPAPGRRGRLRPSIPLRGCLPQARSS